MLDHFLARSKRYGLSAEDAEQIAAQYGCMRQVAARTDVAGPDGALGTLHVLLDGWACKYRLMSDGRRQIIVFLLPGDICDLDRLIDGGAGVGVTALTDCKVATVATRWLAQLRVDRPAVGELLWKLMGHEHAAMSEQIVALGRRTSRQRIAFLLCDLVMRLQTLGLVTDCHFHSPLTQTDIADALGLSTVHVKRTLQGLREDGLIEMRGRSLRVPRLAALRLAADYECAPALARSA